MLSRRSLFAFLFFALPVWASDDLPFDTVRLEPGLMAVPKGWRAMDAPGELLYRAGDGIGVPAVDETGEPLQIGNFRREARELEVPTGHAHDRAH